jgi:hypothetical protein
VAPVAELAEDGHSEPAVVDPAHVWPAALDDVAMVRDGAEDNDAAEGDAEVYVDSADQSHGASFQVLLQTSFKNLTSFAFFPVSIAPARALRSPRGGARGAEPLRVCRFVHCGSANMALVAC